jgi:glycosyltransferase involved in cell wall biosynthesis
MKRLAAFVPNVLGFSPGQRFRIETWAGFLRDAGWTVDFYPFEDGRLHADLYRRGRILSKVRGVVARYWHQARLVRSLPPYDVFFVYREAALIGPAVLERWLSKFGIPIIFDIDDPIFLFNPSPANGYLSLLKFPRKTKTLLRLSHETTAINRALGDFAARYCRAVTVVPNFVDTELLRPAPGYAQSRSDATRLIWTGSASTMHNLAQIASPLLRLQAERRVTLVVLGVGSVDLPGVSVDLRQWSPANEVSELQAAEVGLLPVPPTSWNRWKFFLKAIQYMAVGLPVVAQRIGSNADVIQDGVNGFLVDTEEDWYQRLRLLCSDGALRQRMGKAARETAERSFSLHAWRPSVLAVFERAVRGRVSC